MDASNKTSAVTQGLDCSAFERAAFVFTLSFLAATSVGPDLHQFLAPVPACSSLALADAYGLADPAENHPAEAARMTVVREARALFCECMLRALDKEWVL
jgi:hypothetical protein